MKTIRYSSRHSPKHSQVTSESSQAKTQESLDFSLSNYGFYFPYYRNCGILSYTVTHHLLVAKKQVPKTQQHYQISTKPRPNSQEYFSLWFECTQVSGICTSSEMASEAGRREMELFIPTLTTGHNPHIILLWENTYWIIFWLTRIRRKLNPNMFLSWRSFINYVVY